MTAWSSAAVNQCGNVSVRMISKPGDPERKEIALIINDSTTLDDVRKVWNQVVVSREMLRKTQGSDLRGDKHLIHLLALKMYARYSLGGSYGEIALATNYECLSYLCQTVSDAEQDRVPPMNSCIRVARAQLAAMRISEERAQSWLEGGVEDIRSGVAPWTLRRGPVDKEQVRYAVAALERDVKARKLVIAPNDLSALGKMKDLDIEVSCQAGAHLARSLLATEPERGGLDELDRVIARHTV